MLPSHSRANGVITGSPPYTVNGLPDEWVALDTGVRFLSIKFRAITHTLSLSSPGARGGIVGSQLQGSWKNHRKRIGIGEFGTY